MTDPRMDAQRKRMEEFGRAGKAVKLFRHAIRTLITQARDTYTSGRLLKAMLEVIHTDSVSDKGKRKVSMGNVLLLKGFDFNIDSRFESLFQAPFTSSIDRTTGIMQIDIAPFDSMDMMQHPFGATHFKFISSGCEIDFKNEITKEDNQTSGYYAIDHVLTPAVSLTHNVTPDSSLPLFHLLGVQYFELVNGKYEVIKAKAFNPPAIIGVDKL